MTPRAFALTAIALAALAALAALVFLTWETDMSDPTTTAFEAGPEDTLFLELENGRVVIAMRPDLAPGHVARIKELAREGFYDNAPFHRVIPGFMAQTGDPTGTGRGGSGQKLGAEFSEAPHVRGTVSMARAGHPDSADSQFFIVFESAPHLNGQYTVWGQVVDGMQHVDAIKAGSQSNNGAVPGEPDRILSLKVAADVE